MTALPSRPGHLRRLLTPLIASFVIVHLSSASEAIPESFLQAHCLRCHGEKKQKGGLRLDTLSRDFTQPTIVSRWADVLEKINSREMPPEEEPQPKPEDVARFVEQVSLRIKEGEAARLARREPVSLKKLTREEYARTIEDLLGVRYVPEDPGGLTEDADYNGFERIGSVLTLSPSHIEKYLSIARNVLDEALPEMRPVPFKEIRPGYKMTGNSGDWKKIEDQGRAHQARAEVWPNWLLRRVAPPRITAAGLYRVRIRLSGLPVPGGEAPRLRLYAENLDRVILEQDIIAPEDKPIVVEAVVPLPPGLHTILLYNTASGPHFNNYSTRDGGAYSPFFSIKDSGRPPWQNKLTDEDGKPIWPFLIVDWVEWEGPLLPDGPTFAEKHYLPGDFTDRAQVAAALTRFAERAFRRPPTGAEVERLMKIYESERAAEEKFALAQAAVKPAAKRGGPMPTGGNKPLAALKTAMMAVLCSKDFLHLVEGAPDRADGRLNAWELASRLSYFLWGTMPDEALFAVARDGSLLRSEVLRAQFTRMMADPRALRFSEGFARSWLQLRKLGMFPPDKTLYPDYSKHLETSMARETTGFFREVLEKNLTLREFIQSDWTVLNARLARHYGIEGVEGDEFRRVALKPEHRRGGLLTQAAILSLTSDGTRHRPVHRGVWISEAILGRHVPPPPGNIDPIEPTPPDQPKATLRQKLDAHKKDASCAECHRKIDPLGLAFEHYDAIGRWRTVEVMSDGAGAHPKVDASGELPDGQKFADQDEFKRLLLADLDQFNSAVAEKLAMFALRRTLAYDDRAALARIAAQSKAADYRLRALLEAVVMSDLFQQR
jgi:hypothetical protein